MARGIPAAYRARQSYDESRRGYAEAMRAHPDRCLSTVDYRVIAEIQRAGSEEGHSADRSPAEAGRIALDGALAGWDLMRAHLAADATTINARLGRQRVLPWMDSRGVRVIHRVSGALTGVTFADGSHVAANAMPELTVPDRGETYTWEYLTDRLSEACPDGDDIRTSSQETASSIGALMAEASASELIGLCTRLRALAIPEISMRVIVPGNIRVICEPNDHPLADRAHAIAAQTGTGLIIYYGAVAVRLRADGIHVDPLVIRDRKP